jgi:hypothetical protein
MVERMRLCPLHEEDCIEAGLDEGFLSFSLSNLVYMENPYSYKKCQ